ncbi:NAD(P)/FAD-dependent oxidoreductase [Nocardioides sp.]|uniref:phytoene desaturase family protein n=1 Tax=Nocardioides sp. TaxID=35761 RepID=UPI0027191FD7|nr:NAD(P)/FAD-dependent oxidoreductase [Nocardioides sp.]MDO9454737.1 NAD(P)/FAD-dependent oxidoreductase [Nocardioides sp.]
MAQVVVVGGGYGGLASAARLAKLGHDVTLLEASSGLGGALTTVESQGFTWEAGPTMLHVPAVVRDLFRKTGRALEAELGVETGDELTPLPIVREHRFEDRSALRLPAGSRRAQVEAFDELGRGLGEAWDAYVTPYAEVWDVLRRHYFEEPWTPDRLPREVSAILDGREHLHKTLRRAFRDDRPATVAGHLFAADGHDLRNVPTWAGVTTYLEQLFGAWTMPGGMHRLRDLLAARLETRGVTVLLDSPALDLVVRDGRVAAVRTGLGEVAADVVVCAIDPRRLPTLAPLVERTMPSLPPVITHLGLEGDLGIDVETVVHGDPMVVVRPGGTAPPGHTAWTLQGRGRLSEDMLKVLARVGLDVRDRVAVRVDRTPYDTVQAWGGSPYGVLWQGRGTVRQRLGPRTPVAGVYAAGAHATPGSGLAYVGLGAALVAGAVGPA